MKVLKWLDDNLEAFLLVILLALITCVMFMQIIMTNVFRHALNWPDEFCRICFVYSGFLCFAYCQKKRNAIKIDSLENVITRWELYTENLKKVLSGEEGFTGDSLLLVTPPAPEEEENTK